MFAAVAVAGIYDESINNIGNSVTNTVAIMVVAEMISNEMTANMLLFM